MLFAAAEKIQSYLFCGNMVYPFSGCNSVFLLSPTTKWFSKEFAILDEIISLIIVCFWTYRFMVPSFVKSKRRNWYKKILPEQSASLYVQISASHLEFCSATGKSVIFSYKPQTKKGERICLKRIRQPEKSLKQKMAYILWVQDIELVDVGPVLFVDKNDVPARITANSERC